MKVRQFEVSRGGWTNFTDPTGTYLLPLTALVTIEVILAKAAPLTRLAD
jgi:hypothetical protein